MFGLRRNKAEERLGAVVARYVAVSSPSLDPNSFSSPSSAGLITLRSLEYVALLRLSANSRSSVPLTSRTEKSLSSAFFFAKKALLLAHLTGDNLQTCVPQRDNIFVTVILHHSYRTVCQVVGVGQFATPISVHLAFLPSIHAKMGKDGKISVMFVCLGNICRS